MQILTHIWTWLGENNAAINAVFSGLTLLVWILYFQLLLNTYRYRLRPRILINRAAKAMEAHCVVTNMSVEKIYLESVLVTLELEDYAMTCGLSDIITDGNGRQNMRYQGPLASGEMLDIGSFRSIIEHGVKVSVAGGLEIEMKDVKSALITTVATYTAEERVIGAERRFILSEDDRTISSRQYSARQILSGRRQREIERWVVQNL